MSKFDELYEKVSSTKKVYTPKKIMETYNELVEKAYAAPLRDFVSKNQVRNAGKLIRKRKRVATRKGFTYDAEQRHVVRLTAIERVRRSQGAKIAATKRSGQRSEMNYKRAMSNHKRKSLGWDK